MLCSIFLWKNGKTPPALPGMYGAKGGRNAVGTVGRAGCVNTGWRVGDGIGTPGVQFAGQPLVGEDVDGGTGKDPSGPRGLLPRGGGHRHFGELSGERAGLFGTRLFRGAGTGMDSQLGTAAAGGRRGILADRGQGSRTAAADRSGVRRPLWRVSGRRVGIPRRLRHLGGGTCRLSCGAPALFGGGRGGACSPARPSHRLSRRRRSCGRWRIAPCPAG